MITSLLTALRGLAAPQWIAIAALLVSLTSLTIATLSYRRDRPKLKISARFYPSNESGGPPGQIELKMVNIGRRPVYLVTLWGSEKKKGPASGSFLDYKGPGIKLAEHETTSLRITHLPRGENEYDASAMMDDDFIDFEWLTIEDSTGRCHEVRKARPLLRALKADYKEWCDRTGYWKPAQAPQAVTQQPRIGTPPPALPAASVDSVA